MIKERNRMFLSQNEEYSKLIEAIGETLIKYGIDEDLAYQSIRQSNFYRLLKKDPQSVMHYSVDEWAEDVMEEFDLFLLMQ